MLSEIAQQTPVLLPSRKCPTFGCPNLTRSGKCPACTKAHNQQRGNSRERGYTRNWEKVSRMFLRRNPLCMDPFGNHSREHRVEASKVTDHIVPHQGDPTKFRDPNNLGSLCVSCHNKKTFMESSGHVVTYQRLTVKQIQSRTMNAA